MTDILLAWYAKTNIEQGCITCSHLHRERVSQVQGFQSQGLWGGGVICVMVIFLLIGQIYCDNNINAYGCIVQHTTVDSLILNDRELKFSCCVCGMLTEKNH